MALVSKHELGAEVLLRYQYDSVGFVRDFFGVEPDDWQIDVLKAVDDGDNVAIRSGHGVGKTALLAWIAIQTTACFPFSKAPCTAPTQHQLSDLLWAEIALWLSMSPLKGALKWTATKLAPRGYEDAWFAVARSCRIPENLAGFHAKKIRFIVDEGSGVPDNIFEVVDGALTTEGAQMIMAGNPTQRSGYFFHAFHKSKSKWHTVHISSEDSPRVSKQYPKDMAEKWGRDTDVYRVRVQGDFPMADSASFIPLDMVERAIMNEVMVFKEDPVEIGLDVARYGDDQTVFAIRKGRRVLPLEAHRGWSTTQIAGRAIQLIQDHSVDAIKVDDTGVGGGVVDILSDTMGELRLNCNLVPCNNGGPGDDSYHNEAAIMWGHVKDLMKTNDLQLPDDDELVAQLTTRHYKLSQKGKIQLERKEDMKKPPRSLPSPDKADALALALFDRSVPPAGEAVEVDDSWEYYRAEKAGRDWYHDAEAGRTIKRVKEAAGLSRDRSRRARERFSG
ncbi:MAG: terminase B [Candidatus Magasanikbacteria bacterium]